MRPLLWLATLPFGLWACDDTSKAVADESREQAHEAKQAVDVAGKDAKHEVKQLKRNIESAADRVRHEAGEVADDIAQKVDEVDKSIARDIKGEPKPEPTKK